MRDSFGVGYILFPPSNMPSCTIVVFPLNVYATVSSVWLSESGKPKSGGGIASAGAAAKARPARILENSIVKFVDAVVPEHDG